MEVAATVGDGDIIGDVTGDRTVAGRAKLPWKPTTCEAGRKLEACMDGGRRRTEGYSNMHAGLLKEEDKGNLVISHFVLL